MKRTQKLFAMILAFSIAAFASNAGEAVQNSSFAEWKDGKPADWLVASKGIKVSKVENTGLKESKTALQVDVAEENSRFGEIRQEVKVTSKLDYTLTFWMKCTKGDTAFVMVKLREGRTEGKRIASEKAAGEWKKYEIKFNAEDADNIQVLCRCVQKTANVGAVCQWTGFTLTKTGN
ncbi:MAG: carbohydrate binding domain-containing protein [Planctomycetes bacterium]|nr:carbohydrate binding domain-containing protein [Planctomycetota bacterium]